MRASAARRRDVSSLPLWPGDAEESSDYLTRQLVTYLGNKRSLLGPIGRAVEQVQKRLGRKRLRILDAFAGSGVVSRFMKRHAGHLVSNDIEDYAAVIGRCFLQNRSDLDERVFQAVEDLDAAVDVAPFGTGFIERLYAPRDDAAITANDRVFYSRGNARRLDNYRRLIAKLPRGLHDSLLGPLLSEASVHANTSGVFKGFHKNPVTGIGQFGGGGADALGRILGRIRLSAPVLSAFECDVEVTQQDANGLVRSVPALDLAYLDPPYNQHPYGSNYFMLNLIVNYEEPAAISRVSGIPEGWRRSPYNVRATALTRMRELVTAVDSKFLLVSFNDEGFIAPDEMRALLGSIGRMEVVEIPYATYRGSRNLRGRNLSVTEQLFLVEKA